MFCPLPRFSSLPVCLSPPSLPFPSPIVYLSHCFREHFSLASRCSFLISVPSSASHTRLFLDRFSLHSPFLDRFSPIFSIRSPVSLLLSYFILFYFSSHPRSSVVLPVFVFHPIFFFRWFLIWFCSLDRGRSMFQTS